MDLTGQFSFLDFRGTIYLKKSLHNKQRYSFTQIFYLVSIGQTDHLKKKISSGARLLSLEPSGTIYQWTRFSFISHLFRQ